jgi:hypothetical protein
VLNEELAATWKRRSARVTHVFVSSTGVELSGSITSRGGRMMTLAVVPHLRKFEVWVGRHSPTTVTQSGGGTQEIVHSKHCGVGSATPVDIGKEWVVCQQHPRSGSRTALRRIFCLVRLELRAVLLRERESRRRAALFNGRT